MGKDNPSNWLAITVRLPTLCQRNILSNIIEMVVVLRPSPTLKKRPAAAGLFFDFIPSLASHKIHGFPQPRLAEVMNAVAISEAQR